MNPALDIFRGSVVMIPREMFGPIELPSDAPLVVLGITVAIERTTRKPV